MTRLASLSRRALLKLAAAAAILPAPRRAWAQPAPVTLTFAVTPPGAPQDRS